MLIINVIILNFIIFLKWIIIIVVTMKLLYYLNIIISWLLGCCCHVLNNGQIFFKLSKKPDHYELIFPFEIKIILWSYIPIVLLNIDDIARCFSPISWFDLIYSILLHCKSLFQSGINLQNIPLRSKKKKSNLL